jgi:predicted solute-binding protein
MRLLLEDTLATAPFVLPVLAGWIDPNPAIEIEVRTGLHGADLTDDELALLSAAEVLACRTTHLIVADVAVVADGEGAVAMRTPVRPDRIDRTPIRMRDASATAELLARATLRPFYGIEPTIWVHRDDEPAAAEAQVVVVEGAEALRTPEAGFSEDLCRAWLILSGTRAVTHVLVAPLADGDEARLAPALSALAAIQRVSDERRREWRADLANREGIEPSRLSSFFSHQRYKLDPRDETGLRRLLRQGRRGAADPPPDAIQFMRPATPPEARHSPK